MQLPEDLLKLSWFPIVFYGPFLVFCYFKYYPKISFNCFY